MRPSYPEASWKAATATSEAVKLSGVTLCGLFIPPGFTGTTLTFKAAYAPDGTFVPVKDEAGATLSYTVAASSYCRVRPSDFAGIEYLQVVAGSSQAANTVVKLSAREIT